MREHAVTWANVNPMGLFGHNEAKACTTICMKCLALWGSLPLFSFKMNCDMFVCFLGTVSMRRLSFKDSRYNNLIHMLNMCHLHLQYSIYRSKTVMRPSYLYKRNSCSEKTSLYWNNPPASYVFLIVLNSIFRWIQLISVGLNVLGACTYCIAMV